MCRMSEIVSPIAAARSALMQNALYSLTIINSGSFAQICARTHGVYPPKLCKHWLRCYVKSSCSAPRCCCEHFFLHHRRRCRWLTLFRIIWQLINRFDYVFCGSTPLWRERQRSSRPTGHPSLSSPRPLSLSRSQYANLDQPRDLYRFVVVHRIRYFGLPFKDKKYTFNICSCTFQVCGYMCYLAYGNNFRLMRSLPPTWVCRSDAGDWSGIISITLINTNTH